MEVAASDTPVWFMPGSEGLLSPFMPWMQDKKVSEILVNRPHEVFVEKHGILTRFELPMLTGLHLRRLFTFIANENGQELNEVRPLLSGNLYDGSRVQLVIPPASQHFTLSIRRKSMRQLTLAGYSETPFFESATAFRLSERNTDFQESSEKGLRDLYQQRQWAAFIAQAIALKKNIVVSGGTSSGKTTFLNACIQEIPKDERIITLEDTFELEPPHLNSVRLLALKKISHTESGVCMQDLVQCALRLRPDRLLMGEIRGKEILDFVSACATGHEGSLTSIHANNPQIAFMRMVQLYKLNNVPSMRDEAILQELRSVIDIIVQLKKTEAGRVVSSVYYKDAEVMA